MRQALCGLFMRQTGKLETCLKPSSAHIPLRCPPTHAPACTPHINSLALLYHCRALRMTISKQSGKATRPRLAPPCRSHGTQSPAQTCPHTRTHLPLTHTPSTRPLRSWGLSSWCSSCWLKSCWATATTTPQLPPPAVQPQPPTQLPPPTLAPVPALLPFLPLAAACWCM